MIGVQNAKAHQTPTANGVYYIQNVETGKFLSRGSSWGTRAIVDDYGTPWTLVEDGNNFKIKHPDGNYLGYDTWMYTDKSDGNVRSYTLTTVDGVAGGYTLKNTSNSMNVYVYLQENADKYCVAGNAIKGDNYTDDDQTYWRFLSSEERAAVLTSNNNSDATAIATAAGISGVTSKDNLRVALGRFYNATDKTTSLTNASLRTAWTGWTPNYTAQKDSHVYYTGDNCTELWQASGSLSQTTSSLPAGIYKVTFNACFRIVDEATLYTLKDGGQSNMSNGYVQAGAYKGQIKGLDVALVRSGSAGSYTYNPSSRSQFISKLSSYAQDFYTYQATEGTMNVSIASPAYQVDNWTVINDVTLTQYSAKTLAEIADGTYFLYSASDNKFLSRGNSFGTRAKMDDYGLPVVFATTDGLTTISFPDNGKKLFDAGNGTVYTDNTSNPNWVLEQAEGGFYIVNGNDNGRLGQYLYVNTSDSYNLACTSDRASATIWSVKTGAQQESIVSAKTLANKVSVAASAGETIATTDAFNTWISGLNMSDVTATVIGSNTLNNNSIGNWENENTRKNSHSWNKEYAAVDNIVECFSSANKMTLSLKDLPQGVYKATINGFYRDGSNANAWTQYKTNHMNVGHAYFKANNYQIALADWASEATKEPYNPDNTGQANTALNTNNKYLNELYTYVDADGNLTLQIGVPGWMDEQGWACYSNVKLYYYSEKSAPTSIALDETEVSLDENDAATFTLNVTPTPAEASSEVVWTSSNTDVAIVDNSGEVTVISTGIATITAISALDANVSATCNLTVNYPEYTSYNKSFEKDGTTYYLSSTNLIKNGDFSYPDSYYGYTNGNETALASNIWTINEDDGNKYLTSSIETGSQDNAKRLYTHWAIENGKQYVFGFNVKGAANARFITTSMVNSSYGGATQISGGESETYTSSVWNSVAYLIDNTTANKAFIEIHARWLQTVNFDKFYLAEVVGSETSSDGTKTVDGEVTEDYIVTPSETTPIVDISGATFDGELSADFSSNANGFIIATAAQKATLGGVKNVVVDNTCDNLVLTDGTDFVAPGEFTATSANYSRAGIKLSKDRYATVYLPYAFSTDGLKVMEYTSYEDGVLTFTPVDVTVPSTPYLVRIADDGEEDVVEDYDFSGSGVVSATDASGDVFKGTYNAQTLYAIADGYNYYGFSAKYGDFRQASVSGNTCAAFRAYLKLSDGTNARVAVRFDDDKTTGIVTLDADGNINGAEVMKDGKYIIDNKVVIVKNGVKYGANGQKLN